jgi:hypothetical protein
MAFVTTQVTTLAQYPSCIHWHFKRGGGRGKLEVTYWPDRNKACLACPSGREADWIGPVIYEFRSLVKMRAVGNR